MGTNHRESFRIEHDFEAELFHEGRVVPCTVHNLSAGGALVESAVEMAVGSQCTLGLRLDPVLADRAGIEYLSIHMDVLEGAPRRGGDLDYRLRNQTAPGSREYEDAMRVVIAAQRQAIAHERGTDDASPMAIDDEPRRRRRSFRSRFGKGSLRPDSRD